MGKRIITESEVMKMATPGDIVVDGDTIITPAALDAAFEKGLQVIYKQRATRISSFSSRITDRERHILRELSGLSDGNYLLQIREGRLRAYRIEDKGVFPVTDSR